MSSEFNPYHKWLGIPLVHQPPHHYRLLGIELFETDRDVIDSAANQRMLYLQDIAGGGDHVEASQKLLNEVASARRCLLNPGTKAQYDQALQVRLNGHAPAQTAPVPAAPEAPEPDVFHDIGDFDDPGTAIVGADESAVAPTAQSARAAVPRSAPAARSRPRPGSGSILDAIPAKFRVWIIASMSALTVLALAIIFFLPSKGKLVINWPLNERDGAAMQVDGKAMKAPPTASFVINLSTGAHKLTFHRKGRPDLVKDVTVSSRQGQTVDVEWSTGGARSSLTADTSKFDYLDKPADAGTPPDETKQPAAKK